MKNFCVVWLLVFFGTAILAVPSPAYAQERTTNGGACTTSQDRFDWDTIYQCVSSVWQRGAVFFGASAATCNTAHAGMIAYFSGTTNLKFCDGSTWQAIGTSIPPNPGCNFSSGTLSSPQNVTITVPAGCTVTFKAWGGGGGSGGGNCNGSGWGGSGGRQGMACSRGGDFFGIGRRRECLR